MNTAQAAEYLGMNPNVLRAKAGDGKVPCVRMGGRWRFSAETLDAWMAAGCPDRSKNPQLWDPNATEGASR